WPRGRPSRGPWTGAIRRWPSTSGRSRHRSWSCRTRHRHCARDTCRRLPRSAPSATCTATGRSRGARLRDSARTRGDPSLLSLSCAAFRRRLSSLVSHVQRIVARIRRKFGEPAHFRVEGLQVAAEAGQQPPEAGQQVGIGADRGQVGRSEEHTSELQSRENLVCRLLLEKKKKTINR